MGAAPCFGPLGLERHLRAGATRLHRLPRAWGAAARSDQSRAIRRACCPPLSQRPALRLRRVPGNGGALVRALRRGRDHRRGRDPLRAVGYESRIHARSRLAPRWKDSVNGDPVSWLMIEPGWKVVDSQGQEVGSIDEVAGDSSDDIFNGLSISTSLLGKPRYLPSEQVGTITEGRVHLKLTKDQVEHLGEFEAPAMSAEILPEQAGAVRRAEAAVEAPTHSHPEGLNFLTRVTHALR